MTFLAQVPLTQKWHLIFVGGQWEWSSHESPLSCAHLRQRVAPRGQAWLSDACRWPGPQWEARWSSLSLGSRGGDPTPSSAGGPGAGRGATGLHGISGLHWGGLQPMQGTQRRLPLPVVASRPAARGSRSTSCLAGMVQLLNQVGPVATCDAQQRIAEAGPTPPEWAEVLSRASRFPGCAPVGKVYETWRTWQLGSITWVDPFSVPAPSRSEALASSWSRAHRSMLAWLDADPEFLLPRTCIVCGDASRNVCGDCMEAVCLDCVANALAQGGPVFGQIFCCSEMAAGEGVRSTAPPLRPSQSRREVAQAIMQFVPPRWEGWCFAHGGGLGTSTTTSGELWQRWQEASFARGVWAFI